MLNTNAPLSLGPSQHPLRIGLTGGIGCGKSSVAKVFTELGIEVIDSDAIAHQVTGINGPAIPAITAEFGQEFICADGSMNRPKMREYVFTHPESLQQLEAITHPFIQQASAQAIQKISLKSPVYIVLMIPLLFESKNWQQSFHKIIVVDCAIQTQIARVMARSQMNESLILQIIAKQTPREFRLQQADYLIDNEGSPTQLLGQVRAIHDQLVKISTNPSF